MTGRRAARAHRAAAVGAAALALLLSGCTAAQHAASTPTTPVALPAGCPTAGELASLLAEPLTGTSVGDACVYTGGPLRIVVTPDAAPTGSMLTAQRATAIAAGDATTDLPDRSFDAFTASAGSTCTAWFYGPDGSPTAVAVQDAGAEPADRCSTASAAAALLPAPAKIAAPIVALVGASDALDTSRLSTVAAELGAASSARVDTVSAPADGDATAADAALLRAVRTVPPTSRAVVLVIGTADAAQERLSVLKSTLAALSGAQRRAPRARLVIVGPWADDGQEEPELDGLRTGLAEAAAVDRATYVDPVDEGWTPATTSVARAAADRSLAKALAARIP